MLELGTARRPDAEKRKFYPRKIFDPAYWTQFGPHIPRSRQRTKPNGLQATPHLLDATQNMRPTPLAHLR